MLREADPCSAPTGPTRWSRGSAAASSDSDDCPPEVLEVLALGAAAERDSGGAFAVPGPDRCPRPERRGQGLGGRARRGALSALPDTDFCLSAGGDMTCRTASRRRPWRIGIEDPHDPAAWSPSSPCGPARSPPRAPPSAARTSSTRAPAEPPDGVASVTVVGGSLTWADIDATAAYALGARRRAVAGTRPGRTGLVVWDDGTTTTVSGVTV